MLGFFAICINIFSAAVNAVNYANGSGSAYLGFAVACGLMAVVIAAREPV